MLWFPPAVQRQRLGQLATINSDCWSLCKPHDSTQFSDRPGCSPPFAGSQLGLAPGFPWPWWIIVDGWTDSRDLDSISLSFGLHFNLDSISAWLGSDGCSTLRSPHHWLQIELIFVLNDSTQWYIWYRKRLKNSNISSWGYCSRWIIWSILKAELTHMCCVNTGGFAQCLGVCWSSKEVIAG